LAFTQIEVLAFSQGQQQHFPKSEELLKNFWDPTITINLWIIIEQDKLVTPV